MTGTVSVYEAKALLDRLLIAQRLIEGMPLLTVDPLIEHYPVQTIW